MKIVIPSCGRPRKVWAIYALAPEISKTAIIAVRPGEVDAYHKEYPDNELFVLSEKATDLGKTRQEIWEKYGQDRLVMLDDDITEFKTRSYAPNREEPKIRVEDLYDDPGQAQMFADIEKKLDDPDIAMASPSPNWLQPDTFYWPMKTCANVSQFFAIDGRKLYNKGLRWDRVEWLEDQDFVLQCLEQGLDAVHMLDYMFVIKPMKSKGDKTKLMELWPDYVFNGRRNEGAGLLIRRALLFKESRRRRRMGKPKYASVEYDNED